MRPEILAPAGDVDKLKTAFHFGADAVYLGLKRHSLRNFARNFDFDELEWALGHARTMGRRIYVTLNLIPLDDDFPSLEADLATLEALAPDGLIIADPGVVNLARTHAPSVPIHLSTQANVTNAYAARFWFTQGVERIIVARELSIDRLRHLASQAGGPIEAFVHGAVCISYSGRCFLSHYWADRDANRGECAQACRWKYREVEERRREGEPHYLMEDDRYTYFFDARDLCALPVLADLYAAGLASWKIEGRMRSAHYVAVVTDVYRRAADLLSTGDQAGFQAALPDFEAEIARVSNREFSTHFLPGGVPDRSTYHNQGSSYRNADAFLGVVAHRTDHFIDVALKNKVEPGMSVELRDAGFQCEALTVGPLFTPDGTDIAAGHSGTTVRIPGSYLASKGAILRRA